MSKLNLLGDCVISKTIRDVQYLAHEVVVLYFTDGSALHIEQTMQAGNLDVWYLANDIAREVEADNAEVV